MMDKESAKDGPKETLADLEDAARDLKERIIEEKKRNAMPINSSLGEPEVDARTPTGATTFPKKTTSNIKRRSDSSRRPRLLQRCGRLG
jgi:hypothetical protein